MFVCNPAPKRSPESHIGKHLTFASQITVAELKNDAIVEHNHTANFNETMVSPMFLEKKGSEGSPEASVSGSSDIRGRRKRTTQFKEPSES